MIQTCPCCNGEFRKCNACGLNKPVDEFPFDKIRGKATAECHLCKYTRNCEYKTRVATTRIPINRSRSRHLPALRECIAAHMTGREAAKCVGISTAYAYELAKQYGLPAFAKPVRAQKKNSATRFWSDDRLKPIAKLARAGLSASQISSKIPGTTRNSIIGAIHRNRDRLAELAR